MKHSVNAIRRDFRSYFNLPANYQQVKNRDDIISFSINYASLIDSWQITSKLNHAPIRIVYKEKMCHLQAIH